MTSKISEKKKICRMQSITRKTKGIYSKEKNSLLPLNLSGSNILMVDVIIANEEE
jgi:hypothetical protein